MESRPFEAFEKLQESAEPHENAPDNRLTADSLWFPQREKMTADFTLTKSDSSKMIAFLGSHEVTYSDVKFDTPIPRSDERRVGKECRSRWSPYH